MEMDTRKEILELEREIAIYTSKVLSNKKQRNDEYSNDHNLEKIVNYIVSRASLNENLITSNLLGLQEETSYFVEFNKRFKTRERVRDKILQKMRVDNLSLIEASESICDSLRYTIVIDEGVYTEKVDLYLSQLKEIGYEVVKFKNAWNSEFYKGINVSFINSEGFKFELQFHTPNSFSIKEGKLRDVYNIIRDPDTPRDLVDKANRIRRYYQAQVKIPEHAIDYTHSIGGKRIK